MNIKDFLETGTYVFALVGGIVGASLFLKRARFEAISRASTILQRAWTNEGDVSSDCTHFITFELADAEGDLIGSLQTNRYERVLEVHARVGWFSTIIYISELVGRGTISTATVKVKIHGNSNRLAWKVVSGNESAVIPRRTVLWPSPVGVSR